MIVSKIYSTLCEYMVSFNTEAVVCLIGQVLLFCLCTYSLLSIALPVLIWHGGFFLAIKYWNFQLSWQVQGKGFMLAECLGPAGPYAHELQNISAIQSQ